MRLRGLITLATYGIGMLIGFSVAGQITQAYTTTEATDWTSIWLFPAAFAGVVLVLFAADFQKRAIAANRGQTAMKQQLPRRELLKQLAAGAIGASVLGSGLLLSGAAVAAPVTGWCA